MSELEDLLEYQKMIRIATLSGIDPRHVTNPFADSRGSRTAKSVEDMREQAEENVRREREAEQGKP